MNRIIAILTLILIAILAGLVVDDIRKCFKRKRCIIGIVGIIIMVFLFYTTVNIVILLKGM